MARKRKRRVVHGAVATMDFADIETQVERDRLKELEQLNQLHSRPTGDFMEDGTNKNFDDHRGIIVNYASRSGSDSGSFMTENGRHSAHDHKYLRPKSTASYEENDFSIDSIEQYPGIDVEEISKCSEDSEADLVAHLGINDKGKVRQYVTLEHLTLLEDDADSLGINGNLIVQNYLECLDFTSDVGSAASAGSQKSIRNKADEKTKQLPNVASWNDSKADNFLSCQVKRKSSLRKKSADETNKSSVSFQVPADIHTRRVKSASRLSAEKSDNGTEDQVMPPGTVAVRSPNDDVDQLTARPKDRRISVASNISNSNKTKLLPLLSINRSLEINGDRQRKTSAVSRASEYSTTSRSRCPSATFDPELEKASTYIHGKNKQFSRANTSITPVKYGLKHLQMNYSENNLEHNQSVIFLDLLKNSCLKSQVRCAEIRNVERRLEMRRKNPLVSTTYYEHKNIVDPYRVQTKKIARTVAQKKKERKEKIKKLSDEISGGLVPTCLTMKIADQREVENIGRNCRYLRCDPPPECESTSSKLIAVDVVNLDA